MANARMVALGVTAGVLGIFVAGTAALSGPQAGVSSTVGTESGERTVEDGGTGPYKAIAVSNSSISTHTIYRPKDLSAFGDKEKLPILAWGNGGCANSSTGHQNYLSEIASHGYLIVAIGPLQAAGAPRGAGGGGPAAGGGSAQLLEAVNWATAQNANPQSLYYRKIDTSKVAVFGHSCGGLQALEVSSDPRVKTTLVVDSGILNSPGAAPAAPAARGGAGAGGGGLPGMPPLTKEHLAKLHSPVFYLLGGETDIAYANGMDDFKRIEKLPVFVANKGVGHGGTFSQPHGSDWAMASVAWLQWQIKGDAEAGKLFTGNPPGLAKKEGWTVDKKNIP
jgi:dienelactone hydrolase